RYAPPARQGTGQVGRRFHGRIGRRELIESDVPLELGSSVREVQDAERSHEPTGRPKFLRVLREQEQADVGARCGESTEDGQAAAGAVELALRLEIGRASCRERV